MTVAEICAEWKDCKKCPLHEIRNGAVVAGEGPATAKFVLVYDCASIEDNASDGALSTIADKTLREVLQYVGITDRDIYFLPLVACAPTLLVPATQTSPERRQLRLPTTDEVGACHKRVTDIIYAIDPYLIFAAGIVSWKALVPNTARRFDTTLAKAAGRLYDAYIPGRNGPVRYPLMPILFSDALVKNPNPAAHGAIGAMVAAIDRARQYVEYVEAENA